MKFLLIFFFIVACANSNQTILVGPENRKAKLDLPTNYHSDAPIPLILFLHGFSMNGDSLEQLLGFVGKKDELNFAVLRPEGTPNLDGYPAFNATIWCCGHPETRVDDVSYLTNLVSAVRSSYSISKVYVVGFSNGGFMANRLACDASQVFDGIVSISGGNYEDLSLCQPQKPINYLQIHGTADKVILFDGEQGKHPGALIATKFWAEKNMCQSENIQKEALNLSNFKWSMGFTKEGFKIEGDLIDLFIPGFNDETDILNFTQCANNTKASLWTVNGLGHTPIYRNKLVNYVWQFLQNE